MATATSWTERTYQLTLTENEVNAMQTIARAFQDSSDPTSSDKHVYVRICEALAKHKELPRVSHGPSK